MENMNYDNQAVYLPQVIEDYKGNPLIEALPPIYSSKQVARFLTVDPGYNKGERDLENHYRFHYVSRLFKYFQPLDTHIDIEQRVSRAIRQGYISKNPVMPQYASNLAQGAQAIRERNFYLARKAFSTASAFTIIGMSGVGKTTAIEKVLALYPQIVQHTHYNDKPLFLTQLVWAKIDCPPDGSLKAMCFQFFYYVDSVLGTDYTKKFNINRMTVDAALPRMSQIATAHCLGLLVIDEIQHLSQAKSGGREKMLNFFVTLVNTVGVPVVFIGTSKAKSVLQSEFRQARRGSGYGDLIWERMQNDMSWDIMLRAMWKHQWTRKQSKLTDALKNTIYDESQGIIDIAVKLYALAQMQAMTDRTESVSVNTIHKVARQSLRLVEPMLDALRMGDVKKLMLYEDIKPLDISEYVAVYASQLVDSTKDDVLPLEEQAILKLLEIEIPSNVACSCVKKVIGASTSGQTLASVAKKAISLALNLENKMKLLKQVDDSGDLRNIANNNSYDGLKQVGLIGGDENDF